MEQKPNPLDFIVRALNYVIDVLARVVLVPVCLLALGLQSCAAFEALATYNPYVSPSATAPQPAATLTIQPEETAKPSPTPQTCIVTATDALNLRAGPGTQYTVTHWLKAGEPLTLTTSQPRGAWIEVTTQSGAHGWVNSTYCTGE